MWKRFVKLNGYNGTKNHSFVLLTHFLVWKLLIPLLCAKAREKVLNSSLRSSNSRTFSLNAHNEGISNFYILVKWFSNTNEWFLVRGCMNWISALVSKSKSNYNSNSNSIFYLDFMIEKHMENYDGEI